MIGRRRTALAAAAFAAFAATALAPGQQPAAVEASAVRADARPSFANDIVPILTKSGCNAGSCHGAAAGKNGFALSLFGGDPAHDHRVLVRELRGRRVDPAAPEQSLLLQKASGRVPHQGGKRLPAATENYAQVLQWIAGGAVDDTATAPRLLRLDLAPLDAVVVGIGTVLPLRATAHYRDGTARDVSALALWSSNDESVLAIDAAGRAVARGRGEASVLARFGGAAVSTQVLVHRDDIEIAWPDLPTDNAVDAHVHAKLRRARVLPAPLCSDEVFVRRVHLDLCDVLPTAEAAALFLADPAPDKRARLVDELLGRAEFAAAQATLWADVLQVDAATMERKGAALLTQRLRHAFATQRPFDAVVRDLLLGSGPTFQQADANFLLARDQPHLLAEHTAQAFLGIRLQCAQCHDHPFENWTMDDYYGFAAFFAQLGRKRGEDPTEWIVFDRGSGEVRHKRDNRVVAPRLLGTAADAAKAPPAGADRRQALADWLASGDNPWFARHVANRVFAKVFGRGIVDPPDDVRISNPPSHPALLDELARELKAARFDVRPLYRRLCTSRTYQQARHPEAPPAALFAGNLVRRLSAEQLLAAIDQVTAVPTRLPSLPLGSHPNELPNGRTEVRFLDLFGRPARTSTCTCDRSAEPTLAQALHLLNGDTIAPKLAAAQGRVLRALRDGTPPDGLLAELYLAAYARRPTASEQQQVLATLPARDDPKAYAAAWQDIAWAILNSQEFLFQH